MIWGLSFVAQRVGLDFFGPFTFNGIRLALGAISLIPLIFFVKASVCAEGNNSWKAALLPGLLAGLVLFSAASFQQVGLKWTTAGKAAFLTGFYILLVPIFGLFIKRKPTAGVWIGAPLGLSGLFLLSMTQDLTMGLGEVLQLSGAFFWAAHILLLDRFSHRVDPVKLSVIQFSFSAFLSLLIGFSFEPFVWSAVGQSWVALVYGGVASVGIAYTFQIFGQRGMPPGPAALILSLETVFAVLFGGLLLGESLGGRELLGCFLMLGGIVLSQLWPVQFKSKPSQASR